MADTIKSAPNEVVKQDISDIYIARPVSDAETKMKIGVAYVGRFKWSRRNGKINIDPPTTG